MTKKMHAYCLGNFCFLNLFLNFIEQVGVLELWKRQFHNQKDMKQI